MPYPAKKRQTRQEQLILSAQLALGAGLTMDWLSFYQLISRLPERLEVYGLPSGGCDSASMKSPAPHFRIIGSAIGALVSGLYLTLFKFSALGLGVSVLLTGLICTTLNRPSSSRLSAITVSGMVDSKPGFCTQSHGECAYRLAESCIGPIIALMAVLWPRHFWAVSIES